MANVNIYDMADTWNAAGTVFSSIKMTLTDTASDAKSMFLDFLVGTARKFSVRKDGSFHIYNSFTDFSNYERVSGEWASNIFWLQTQAVGTGTPRQFGLRSANGQHYFQISESGMNFSSSNLSFGNNPTNGQRRTVYARTADGTEATAGVVITNRGATGAVMRTLAGAYVDNLVIERIANFAFRIKPHAGGSFLRADGTVTTPDKYLELGSNGAMIAITHDGTNFICTAERGTITMEA
jgi:hypothetical protein